MAFADFLRKDDTARESAGRYCKGQTKGCRGTKQQTYGVTVKEWTTQLGNEIVRVISVKAF